MLNCFDCDKPIKMDTDGQLIDATFLLYEHNGEEFGVVKCNKCYVKDPSLRDFQECEVYSRVVGYLRPVKQWHEGKQQEYRERIVYKS